MSKKELKSLNEELQRSIKELSSEFDEKCPALRHKIKELNATTDELESMHKATTVGSLSSTVIGTAATLLGFALAPFTFGASLAVSGVGVVATVAGTACNITNMIKQKNLCQIIKNITDDFQNIISPIMKHLKTISNIIEEIQKKKCVESDMIFSTTMGTLESLLGVSSFAIDLQMAKIRNVATRSARALQMAGRITNGFSRLFLLFDVFSIYQDSTEISEINRVVDKRKAEEIKSNTLKFIHQAREAADLFQETLDEIECVRDTFNREQCVNCGRMHV
ncbi:hypothetical protein QQF64_031085 [Cirrhinus molitorella]|uniref:Uncharacterized protein n=1 Tax=Cirrhinus molitorella TaxID=172907 RepID=A0ABR3N552_9TELE